MPEYIGLETSGHILLEDGISGLVTEPPEVFTQHMIRVRTASGWQDLIVQGPQGIQGPPGPAGGAGYIINFTQSTPSDTWTVTHNLGFIPGGLTIVDNAGTQLVGQIIHDSTNSFRVLFTAPLSGKVYSS